MESNFTPLSEKLLTDKNDAGRYNIILLVIATVTAVILAMLLFFLIQKKVIKTSKIVPIKTLTLLWKI